MNWNDFNNRASDAILRADRLDDLLAELGCDLKRYPGGYAYRGPCPVHGGDGKNFELRTDGHTVPIHWRCHSYHCERIYKTTLLGLVRGILTFQSNGGRAVSLYEATAYLRRFVAGLGTVSMRPARDKVRSAPNDKPLALSREQVRERLVIPSPYFVARGFSQAVLDDMDVGHSPKRGKTILPLYDDTGEVCTGFLERSEKPLCDRCDKCHEQRTECRYGQMRWSLSADFPKRTHLYNYHNVLRSGSPTVLLLEGPGDVLKATEAGLAAVALLGNEITNEQAAKLGALGKEVIISLDNDEAGRSQRWVILRMLGDRGVRRRVWSPPERYKDVGDMSAQEIRDWMARHRQFRDELDAVLGPEPGLH